ncbi:hypothetical protein [Actinomadura sp. WMMA1423]|uniref:hypothetical protein n=1 Tax=Actinomadura sp. WMMA1423 TaxID=2591108 RepID=UPI0011468A9C|nr:hypothetical protein [Actinomadura sp. WMMA1423]
MSEMSPVEELRAAAKVLLCAHRYPVQVLTDAEVEQLNATGRPLADCLECGSREDGQDVAAPLRGPLAAWLEEAAEDLAPATRAASDLARFGEEFAPVDLCNEPGSVRCALTFARLILGGRS